MKTPRVGEQIQAQWDSEAVCVDRWVGEQKITQETLIERLKGHLAGWNAGVKWANGRGKTGLWVNYGPIGAPNQLKFVVNKNRKTK